MTVECPKCKKKYIVNEALIPVGGAPVRCPDCSNIFTLYREPLDIHLEPELEETVSAAKEEISIQPETFTPQKEVPAFAETSLSDVADIETKIPPTEERTKLWEKLQESYTSDKKQKTVSPTIEEELPPTIEEPSAILQEEKFVETPSVELEAEVKPEEIPLVKEAEEKPPTEKEKIEKEAKRLARSLVKDILLYHSDKVKIGLKQGNLAHLIGNEIRKSWRFYKDNFPLEKTGNVNYFKNALNEIIGKGKQIFK